MLVLSACGVLLLTYATAQFQKFSFDQGRAVRCFLLICGGRIMHLVVLCGYQGADIDSEYRPGSNTNKQM